MARLYTPVCDLFGIKVPIFAAGMADVSFAPLTGAVSAAGGLGTLGATYFTPEKLRAEIKAVRRITDRPFGVGLLLLGDIPQNTTARDAPFPDFLTDLLAEVKGMTGTAPPPLTLELAQAQVDAALDERVPVIAAGLGTPDWLIEKAHRVGTKIISLVGSLRQAQKAVAAGTDCLVAQGMEAGGHTGPVGTLVLVPQIAGATNIPVLAAGGIVNGEGIAAALACGAQGAWMGTRFLATRESNAHDNHKRGVIDADERGTAISRCFTGKPSRVLRNRLQERWQGREDQILPMPWQALCLERLVEPARANGLLDLANFPAGQGACMIDDLPAAGDLLRQLREQTIAAIARIGTFTAE